MVVRPLKLLEAHLWPLRTQLQQDAPECMALGWALELELQLGLQGKWWSKEMYEVSIDDKVCRRHGSEGLRGPLADGPVRMGGCQTGRQSLALAT